MLRWTCAAVTGAVLSGFAFLLVTGNYINDGPVLVRLSVTHGLHLGDLFIGAGWLVAMLMLLVLARPDRRPVNRGDRTPLSR
ncbi:hypothetical protein [Geodermatophilus sp. FMUSA9-8]|uniref:hypothetical protein n=1 Tax=Geodermatophilus sp. FMUSA9-8 TaxID=3120155 RepID=UPI00300ABF97